MRQRFCVVILSGDFQTERWKSYFGTTGLRPSALGLSPLVFVLSFRSAWGLGLSKTKDQRPSGYQPHLLTHLHRLSPTFDAEFVEDATRMGFYRVLTYEQLLCNLTIT